MFLDKKELKKRISEERSAGKTDQEIYNKLIETHKDRDEIVVLLTGSLKREDRKKIRIWNTILLVLIGLTIVSKALAVIGISLNSENLWSLLFVFIISIMNVIFFYIVLNYKIQGYNFIATMSLLGLFNSFGKMGEGPSLFINLIVSVSIIGLSFALYMNNKPEIPKKDDNGNHIFK